MGEEALRPRVPLYHRLLCREACVLPHARRERRAPGYDLIWRGVEITTGAQREHRYEVLKKQAEEKGLADDVKFYLEFFQYGCPPHGGFGLGIDRLTMLLCGLTIKDAEFLFRGPNRLTP